MPSTLFIIGVEGENRCDDFPNELLVTNRDKTNFRSTSPLSLFMSTDRYLVSYKVTIVTDIFSCIFTKWSAYSCLELGDYVAAL